MAGFTLIKYTGAKTPKHYKGYVWPGPDYIIPVKPEDAAGIAAHSIFEVVEGTVSAVFSPASAAANVCEMTITLVDETGAALADGSAVFDVWLSDSVDGAGLTSTTASGTVTVKTASGAVLSTYTAKKDLRVQTKADLGTFILEITDSAKTLFYVCVSVGGKTFIADVLVSGDYGA